MKCANVTCSLSSSLEQANNLREVQAMKRLSPHANIIQLHELILWVLECCLLWSYCIASSLFHVACHINLIWYFSDKETGTVSLICELMEMNIYEFIQGKSASITITVQHIINYYKGELELISSFCKLLGEFGADISSSFLPGRKTPLPDHTVKNYMYQLCKSLQHMHR